MRRLRTIMVAVCVAAATGTAAIAGTIEATLVVGGGADQLVGDGNSSWVIWSTNSPDHRNHYDARARSIKGGDAFKMNAPHTVGYTGDINGETTEAAYQQVSGRSANIFLYDLEARTRTSAGRVVNTELWEWMPSISPGYILFGRNNFSRAGAPWRIVLYDREADATRMLDTVTNECGCFFPGQVSDEYATWTNCEGTRCQAWYYDIAADEIHKVPNPLNKYQYSPGVSEVTGDLYFVRSGDACGQNVRLVRWDPVAGGAAVIVSAHPSGYDVFGPVRVFDDTGGHQDVFLDRYECGGRFYGDVYGVNDADTAGIGRLPAGRSARASGSKRHAPLGATPGG